MTLPHRIEAAEGADRALDAEIHESLGNVVDKPTVEWHDADETPFYTSDLNAALTLVPTSGDQIAVFWQVGNDGQGGNPADFLARVLVCSGFTSRETKAVAAAPALALCAAALRAKESSDGE